MLTGMVAAMVAAQLKMASLQAQASELDAMRETVELQRLEIEELQSREPQVVYVEVPVVREVEKPAEHVECGMCGAHVTEWWYARNAADTEFVEVCHDCKELIEEER